MWEGIAQGINVFAGFMSSRNQVAAQQRYYDQVASAQQRSIENAMKLNASLTESEFKVAELKAKALNINANVAYSNAYNQALSAVDALNVGNRVTAFRIGEARNAFASSGISMTGSAKIAQDSIANNTFRDVDQNYKASLNKVSDFLNQKAQLKFAAAMERYSAEVSSKFRAERIRVGLES